MLEIISGAVTSRRDDVFCAKVREAADAGKNVIVIVPDQYSFESDKKLYDKLGPKLFNGIMTAGFNRLAELIGHEFGHKELESAADNSKIIIMFKAVQRFRAEKQAMYYKRSLTKSRFINELISLVADLLRAGISPDELRIASEKLSGITARKLYDISVLYSYYLEGLEASGLRENLTALSDALTVARDNGYFCNKSVFIDGFMSFSFDEYRMIDCMIKQADDVTVSLLLPGSASQHFDSPFSLTLRTQSRLIDIAAEHNKPVKHTVCELERHDDRAIAVIDRYFCSGISEAVNAEGITIVSANDVYDEAEYICSEIEHLVSSKRYRYSDIAVASRDPSLIASVLEGSFERYGIPYFIDTHTKADSSVIVIFIRSIFECVITGQFRTDAIFRYIKSPLCPMLDKDIYILEEYCIRYNVDKDMWLQPFRSFSGSEKAAEKLEALRLSVIGPLAAFKKASEDASAAEICSAFFDLLKQINVTDQVYSVLKRAYDSDSEAQLELARTNKQLWRRTLAAFVSIHDELGEEKLSLRKFYDLFKLMTSRMTVSAPPQKIESVRCINAERSRADNIKVLFLIGANDGIFPAQPRSDGLFTEHDKQQLADLDMDIESSAVHSVENERMVVYTTLCRPTDRLCITYSETNGSGKLLAPSNIIATVKGLFKNLDVFRTGDLPLSYFCTSYRSAYNVFLAHCKEKLAVIESPDILNDDKRALTARKISRANEIATIEKALRGSPIYAAKLDSLPSYRDSIEHSLSSETARQLFFDKKLKLSASKVSDYYKCPFMFFCKFGLGLKEPARIALDYACKGNYLHRTLQLLMSKEKDGRIVFNKNFSFMTDEQVAESVHSAFLRYENESLGGDYGKTPAYYAELAEYEKSVVMNVKLIQEEFKDSGFEPSMFEYKLDKGGDDSVLTLKLAEGLEIALHGMIDRVDVFTDNDGKRYIRIVDYKTREVKLDLDEMYHGLDLQMFIYLLAMTADPELLPAGVQYSFIKAPKGDLFPDDSTTEADLFAARLKNYKPKGMFVGEQNLINALNKSFDGAFTLFKFKGDGELSGTGAKPVTESYLEAIEEFAKRKMIGLAESIAEGKISSSPLVRAANKGSACSYCDYYPICGKVLKDESRKITSKDKLKFEKEIEAILAEKGENENNA